MDQKIQNKGMWKIPSKEYQIPYDGDLALFRGFTSYYKAGLLSEKDYRNLIKNLKPRKNMKDPNEHAGFHEITK